MDNDRPIKIAVLGSGPSGIYAAQALLNQDRFSVTVDIFDRLPTPYGLVRYGVAPDHPNIKSIVKVLQRVMESPQVRFFGDVEFGKDVTRSDFARFYDAVVYATGASVDRALGVPGESLPGSYPATEFVAWYSGHPDAVQPFALDVESVAVVGVGNVAVDVARVLAKTPQDLAHTDVPPAVLQALKESTVRDVHIVGRRGPEHAKFTTKELRELGELVNASVHVLPHEVDTDTEIDHGRLARSNLAVLAKWVEHDAGEKARQIWLRFWLRPAEIVGSERVEGLRCERTIVAEDGAVVGTGEFETLPVQVVLRAVGYRSLPLPDVPFDDDRGVVVNDAGRVLDGEGNALPGEYVAGWLKRGPTGVIGTNKSDAAETVRALVEDVLASGAVDQPAPPSFDDELRERGIRPVDYEGWLRIDAEELARGSSEGRERSKINEWDTLRRLAGPTRYSRRGADGMETA